MIKRCLLVFCCGLSFTVEAFSQSFKISSPDNKTIFSIQLNDKQLLYDIIVNEQVIIEKSVLGLDFENQGNAGEMSLSASDISIHQEVINWPLGERSKIENGYHQQIYSINKSDKNAYAIEVRVFNGSVAFRYLLGNKEPLVLSREKTIFNFPVSQSIYRYKEESVFRPTLIKELKDSCDLPATLVSDRGYTHIGEANNQDYTKSVLTKLKGNSLQLVYFKDKKVKAAPGFMTPWRTVSFTEKAIGLHQFADLNFKLTPGVKEVPQWIKPGKVMRSDLGDKAVKETIDFAAAQGFQYVLLDAGWYGQEFRSSSDPRTYIDALKLPELIQYGKSKKIGIILYVNYVGLKQYLDEILPLYKTWGVAGMKFGFVDGLTQQGITWLNQAIKKTYEHGFVINVHDNYKPSGLNHLYPNWLTQEGIRGNEHGGNSEHDLVLPFTRFLTGPGDFTIGYLNSSKALTARYNKLGFNVTKAHQLALSVLFYSPLQAIFWYGKAADYTNEKEIEFFKQVPTVWDETHYLKGEIGKYISVARRKNDTWYIGNAASQQLNDKIDLSFLQKGKKYKATIYEDDGQGGIKTSTKKVKAKDSLAINVLANGGQAIIIDIVK
ncbi:glycoside hydrolase family 97 protein [Pedobacter frigiditerrae]|nr:glycoside hydrolase family 97 protein [Pedobacter frigiditerrae]